MENNPDVMICPFIMTNDSNYTQCKAQYQQYKSVQNKKYLSQHCLLGIDVDYRDGKLDQKTTNYGAITERSDKTQQASIQQKTKNQPQNQIQIKPLLSVQLQFESQASLHQNDPMKNSLSTVYRLRNVMGVLDKLVGGTFKKLKGHLSKTSTADKYLRLVYSIFKLYRALNPDNNLAKISKEILNTRRIIQWQSKYQLIKQFIHQDLSAFDVAYKSLELSGNLFDFTSFWLHSFAESGSRLQYISEVVYSWQDDCYFYQCLIQLFLSTKNLFKNLKQLTKPYQSEIKYLQIQHSITILEQNKQKLTRKLEQLNKLKQSDNTKNQQVHNMLLKSLFTKIEQKQGEIIKLRESYQLNKQVSRNKTKKELCKNAVKILKYICDSTTSYNNSSWKTFNLNPKLGGVLSILSSLLSMYLIWGF